MVRGREWTGFEAAALQEAMRRSVRDFAALLGLETTTVTNWRAGLGSVKPRSATQAILDTALDQRATSEDRERFEQILREGEAAWRQRHHISSRHSLGASGGLTSGELSQADATGVVSIPAAEPVRAAASTTVGGSHSAKPGGGYPTEITDMNRRELLRLLSIATTLAVPVTIDWDRLRFAAVTGQADAATLAQHEAVNELLWQDYGAAETKAVVFGAAREQMHTLIEGLRDIRTPELRRRQQELIADALQLSGEILLDADHLAEAAHCYALSGTFAAEARAYDLWACALTRHAYLGIFDTRYQDALPLVEQAARIAHRGDSQLPTRYWVESVRAQVLAGLGDAAGCEQAFDAARGVLTLTDTPICGWLRFNGARIDEEQASCLVQLARPGPAEDILTSLLGRPLSTRRRASVLVDLAAAGALRADPVQTVWYGGTAVDIARRTKSGYLGRRLGQLRQHLGELEGDRHIAHLDRQITTLTAAAP
ncbi:tetratricopeptide (TPR) repeat protein [Nocardia transvalensis]|uniref:Tetratricopeptide (TPR) repeat protein n=1 Tax=Nocardia transvalensis TaxID=37333 RepID=A0A7W9UMB0_9NOCA|nr:hypothetical protein [Nocardia transvalensis]MBB5918436.1 tetratricopeptide (TPR) repeat protein [Nocardia transvalensis]